MKKYFSPIYFISKIQTTINDLDINDSLRTFPRTILSRIQNGFWNIHVGKLSPLIVIIILTFLFTAL